MPTMSHAAVRCLTVNTSLTHLITLPIPPAVLPHSFSSLQRSAAVVFESKDDVSQAISHASSGQVVDFPLPAPEGPVGLKAWVAQHKAQRPGNAQLQQQVRSA
jgi:hypothetical protein